MPADCENLEKEKVPLRDGRLRLAVSRRPASARQPQKSHSPRKRRPSSPERMETVEEQSRLGVGTTCGTRTVTLVLGGGDAPDLGGAVVPHGCGTHVDGPRGRSGGAQLQTPLKASRSEELASGLSARTYRPTYAGVECQAYLTRRPGTSLSQ